MLHLESSVHEQYNPYTAVQRSASQWFLFVPDAQPMETAPTTTITLSNDAVCNLNTMPLSAESVQSLASRYVVPEMIPYGSSSDVDTRSAGNPYSHHPNFTTPSQYFDHLAEENKPEKEEEGDVLTIVDIQKLDDPFKNFGGFRFGGAPPVQINPPNDVTLNKSALSAQSLADLHSLQMPFPLKDASPASSARPAHFNPLETLNKKMLSAESMYELEQTPADFEHKQELSNLLKIREFSAQSLADLRELRNISQYTDFQDGISSKDVATCLGISPSPGEIRQFEWTENVAYGGI